jgi:hypothetical protein
MSDEQLEELLLRAQPPFPTEPPPYVDRTHPYRRLEDRI